MDALKGKKILYISYDGMTDPLGQSQVLPYLAGLGKLGYSFTLISFEKEERFTNGKKIIEEICRQHHINWHPLPYTKTPPVLSTIRDIRQLKKKIRQLQAEQPFRIVHCRSYIAALAGDWMKKKWGVKFVFDMRGFWADERVDGNIWNLKNPLYRVVFNYFKAKEKVFFSNADHTVSLTHNAKAIIHAWPQIKNQPVPIQVIPCCVDLDLFDPSGISPAAVDTLKQDLQIAPGQTVLSYIGSIGTWYMLPEMLLFFKQWLLAKPDSVFLFVTNERPAMILENARQAGVPETLIRIRQAARQEMPLFIAAADYSVFFIKPVFSKRASSPTKQGEIMAMGKPVICNSRVGDTDHVINEYHSGVLVDSFDTAAYDKAIKEVLLAGQFNAAAIREGADRFFSLETGIEKYAGVYEAVLNAE